jgi:hypothetical protein
MCLRNNILLMLGFLVSLLSAGRVSLAQAVTGTTSLIMVPTAEVQPDRTLSFGGGFVNRKYTDYLDGSYHYTPYYVSLTYLPFMEVGIRFARAVSPEEQALGDRMVTVRLQLLRERAALPAVVFGVHDLLTSTDSQTNNFNALYLVGTKHFSGGPFGLPVGLHLGYGTDWIRARSHQFVGVFGGISVSPLRFVDVLLEYDGETVNLGQRLRVLKHVQLLVALQNFDVLAGGVNLYFSL